MKAIISPSLLASDLSKLSSECNRILKLGADWLHLDVMDAHFVPNLTFGPPVLKCLRKNVKNGFFDVHIMIENPLRWVEDYQKAGTDMLTFHIEACSSDEQCLETLKKIQEVGMKAGVALKPKTKVSKFLLECVEKGLVDMVLVMTVVPGFGGQKFMKDMMEKIELLRSKFPKLDIQVDGGVGPSTVDFASKAGANVIVAGSSVFKSDDPEKAIQILRKSVEKCLKK